MEAFARLGSKKYTENGVTATYADAAKRFHQEYLSDFFKKFDCHAWRTRVLWNMEADLALKHGLQTLKECYKRYIGKEAKPSAPMFMCLKEFEEVMTKAEVFTENIGCKQMSLHYYLAM